MLQSFLIRFVAGIFFYGLLVQACNSQDNAKNEISTLNKLLGSTKSDDKAGRIEKKIKIFGTDGKEYILYQVHGKDFRDMEECCIALVVDQTFSNLFQLSGYAVEISVTDIDGDGKSEIERLNMSFGQGTTVLNREIYHFDGKGFKKVHEFKGGNNEGLYDVDDKNYKSHSVEFQYKDVDQDGKNELVEKHLIIENGKTSEREEYFKFDGKNFTKNK